MIVSALLELDPLATNPFPPRPPNRTITPNLCRKPAELSASNLLVNHDIGASLHDLLSQEDLGKNFRRVGLANPTSPVDVWPDQVIRLYFQNVNGLTSALDGADILDAFFHMASIKADIFAFAETHLNCHKDRVRSLIHAMKRKVWDQCKIAISSAENGWPSAYQRGGVMTGITGPMVGRVKAQITDDMGRWCGFEVLGRDGRLLVILCCYQVVQRGGTHGPATAYSQQVVMLRMKDVDRPNPRASFVQDLKVLIEGYHKSNSDIILMGDFNEEVGLRANEMAQVIQAGQLTDIQSYCHGLESEESTYARGFFASERLLPHVLRQGCEPFNMRIFSDHRGLFVDFTYPGFFDRCPSPLLNLSQRSFVYDRPEHIRKYLAYMEKYLADHNIPDRAAKLLEARNDADANIFDTDMTTGMLKAAKSIKRFSRHPWSKKLHESITTKYIISKHLSQLLLQRSMEDPINHMQSLLSTPIELPETVQEAKQLLRQAQRNCRKVVTTARDLRKTWQEDRITAKQLANPDEDPETIANVITNRDAMREMWQKIPSSRSRGSSGLSMIKVPEPANADPTLDSTMFRTVSDPNEMECLIIARNKKHFRQAQGRPLTDPGLIAALGWGGDLQTADDILDGIANVETLSHNIYAQAFFRHCKRIKEELPSDIGRHTLQQASLLNRSCSLPTGRAGH